MADKKDTNSYDENDIEVFDDFIEYYGFDDELDEPKELDFESNETYDYDDTFFDDEDEI